MCVFRKNGGQKQTQWGMRYFLEKPRNNIDIEINCKNSVRGDS